MPPLRLGTRYTHADNSLSLRSHVDQGKNPHTFTRDTIERLSGENMFTNGMLKAITVSVSPITSVPSEQNSSSVVSYL